MTIASSDIMDFDPKNTPKSNISGLENDIIHYDDYDFNDEDESELLFFEPYERLQTFTLTNIIRDIYHYIFYN